MRLHAFVYIAFVKLAEREGIIGGDDSERIPSVGLLVSVAVVSMAAISLRSKSE